MADTQPTDFDEWNRQFKLLRDRIMTFRRAHAILALQDRVVKSGVPQPVDVLVGLGMKEEQARKRVRDGGVDRLKLHIAAKNISNACLKLKEMENEFIKWAQRRKNHV